MGLFDKLKSLVSDDKKDTGTIEIIAPLSGEIVNIEDVPDVVFAEKIVGDGIAIKPTGNKMVAPVDGTIGKIFETNHAFSIESDSGVELFVHFGIDTVELKGEGFKRIAEEGQRVKVGDTVIEFDLPLLEEKARRFFLKSKGVCRKREYRAASVVAKSIFIRFTAKWCSKSSVFTQSWTSTLSA